MNAISKGIVYPYGEAQCSGQIKQYAEDFRVVEQLGFTPGGSGEHLFLFIQKNGLTTQQLITQIAEQLGVSARQIGYAGLKDKQAVTRQWLSIQLPGCKQTPEIKPDEHFQVLESDWHDKKLRVGAHRSNRFEVVIRNVSGLCENLPGRVSQIEKHGFANYFGEQRFGAQQDNVAQALKVLNNRHKSKRLNRNKKGLYLSALRSELFNRILSRRISLGHWTDPLDGDVCLLAGTQSVFSEPLSDEIRRRYAEFDLHSGISLYGIGESRLSGQALAIEKELIDTQPAICETLLNEKIKRSFRANRAIARDLKIDYSAHNKEIRCQVELDKGVYLTTLLNHFVQTNVY